MNAVHLIGRLGADPELRVTQGGTSVGKFSLAIPRVGGQEKVTDWFDIVCFGKTAESAGQHLKKGARVGIAGRLQQETWQDKQSGQNRYERDLDEHIIRIYAAFDCSGKPTGDVALVAGQTVWQDCETANIVTSIDEEVEETFLQTWVRVYPDMDAVLVHSNAYDTILVANGAQPALSVDPEVFRSFVKTSDNWADWGSPKSWAEHGDTIGEAAPKYGEIVAFYDGRELTVVDPDRWAERRLYYGADRIDIDEYATTYEDASGNAFEAFQIPWTEVTRILGEKHTGDWEQDQALIRALRAAGAPDWIEEFEGGWCDEYGWGIFGPAKP